LRYTFLSILGIILVLSCGPYSFSGATLSDIKSVYVPAIANETIEYGLGEELTSKVTEAFVADNSLKVVSQDVADAIISGRVISYKRSSYTYNKEDQVQEYKVDIAVTIKFARTDGSPIWEEPNLSAYGLFAADTETEEDGKTEALAKLAEIIVNRTVRDW
jgi:hypothetical protein